MINSSSNGKNTQKVSFLYPVSVELTIGNTSFRFHRKSKTKINHGDEVNERDEVNKGDEVNEGGEFGGGTNAVIPPNLEKRLSNLGSNSTNVRIPSELQERLSNLEDSSLVQGLRQSLNDPNSADILPDVPSSSIPNKHNSADILPNVPSSSISNEHNSANILPNVPSSSISNEHKNLFTEHPYLIKAIQQIQFNATTRWVLLGKFGIELSLFESGFEKAAIHFLTKGFFPTLPFFGEAKTAIGQTSEEALSITGCYSPYDNALKNKLKLTETQEKEESLKKQEKDNESSKTELFKNEREEKEANLGVEKEMKVQQKNINKSPVKTNTHLQALEPKSKSDFNEMKGNFLEYLGTRILVERVPSQLSESSRFFILGAFMLTISVVYFYLKGKLDDYTKEQKKNSFLPFWLSSFLKNWLEKTVSFSNKIAALAISYMCYPFVYKVVTFLIMFGLFIFHYIDQIPYIQWVSSSIRFISSTVSLTPADDLFLDLLISSFTFTLIGFVRSWVIKIIQLFINSIIFCLSWIVSIFTLYQKLKQRTLKKKIIY